MWWFLTIPFLWVLITKIIWRKEITLKECGVHLLAVIPITAIIFIISHYSSMLDKQLIHGKVLNKIRENSSHTETYLCNCEESCETCTKTVYTVDWFLDTTIGNISLQKSSSLFPGVWKKPDPKVFTKAYVGEPCTQYDNYKNYVKGNPYSLFNQLSYTTKKFSTPKYPKIFDTYKVNNVINDGTKINPTKYEELVSNRLKKMGRNKQVNVILILTNTQNINYRYSIENNWIGGKNNDVVIILGIEGNSIIWADGFTFGLTSGNQLLITELKDLLIGNNLSPEIIDEALDTVDRLFKRKPMKDFEYLTESIKPSTTLLVFVCIFQLIANIGITIFNKRNDYI